MLELIESKFFRVCPTHDPRIRDADVQVLLRLFPWRKNGGWDPYHDEFDASAILRVSLGHQQLKNIFAFASEFSPPVLEIRGIVGFLRETAIPGNCVDSSSLFGTALLGPPQALFFKIESRVATDTSIPATDLESSPNPLTLVEGAPRS